MLRNVKEKMRVATKIRNDHFVREYISNGGNATKAAMVVYHPSTPNSAAVIGCEKVRELKPTIVETLETNGNTAEKVVRGIHTLLDAKNIVRVYKKDDAVIVTETINCIAIDKGITQAMKIGLGGGYVSDKRSHKSEAHIIQEMLDFIGQSNKSCGNNEK